MVDTYIWGKVELISPEAPVPIISITNEETRLGERLMSLKMWHTMDMVIFEDYDKWVIERNHLLDEAIKYKR